MTEEREGRRTERSFPAVVRPQKIGRYEVERLIGQGGMGRVYLARDSILGRRVAVKTLRDDLNLPPQHKDALLSRMRHEARAAAAISHPNIVVLHDMGEDDVAGLFLVFEYVEGLTLRARIGKGALPLDDVAELARALGAALTAAHKAGVIHRDIKPENILLSKSGPKIADFGIARIPDSVITQANVVLGTPAYTAPEALQTGEHGPASDQFALAATLYEALAGVRAFPGDDPLEVASKVSNGENKPIESLDCDPRILARLNAVLRRGLAKEPSDRYATAEDFGAALAIALESRVITEPPGSARTPAPMRAITRDGSTPPPPNVETPIRPSLIIRKKTQRAQNVFAALGLLVIIALVVFGRKAQQEDPLRDAASAFQSATSSANAPPPASVPKNVVVVHPLGMKDAGASAPPKPSASGAAVDEAPSPSASASAAPSTSASAAPMQSAKRAAPSLRAGPKDEVF